jgi:hypothetical protein
MVQIVLGLVKLAIILFSWLQARNYMQMGQDKAVAEAATALLLATATGKRLREQVRSATDEDADKLWEEMINVS